ncbi:MAG TPA: CcmD family protein [Saprospiraceae bacterium]|nr:CcmD family protein [Saprospiraceae bacterium]
MGLRCLLLVLIMGWVGSLQAQGDTSPDFMRSIGKIYVVAGVCLIILLALLAYLVILDRKISRLEKRQKNE